MPVGVLSSSDTVAVAARSATSMRVSVRSSRLPTQIEPARAAAIGPGRIPTGDLGDDLVRGRIDQPHVVGLDPTESAR